MNGATSSDSFIQDAVARLQQDLHRGMAKRKLIPSIRRTAVANIHTGDSELFVARDVFDLIKEALHRKASEYIKLDHSHDALRRQYDALRRQHQDLLQKHENTKRQAGEYHRHATKMEQKVTAYKKKMRDCQDMIRSLHASADELSQPQAMVYVQQSSEHTTQHKHMQGESIKNIDEPLDGTRQSAPAVLQSAQASHALDAETNMGNASDTRTTKLAGGQIQTFSENEENKNHLDNSQNAQSTVNSTQSTVDDGPQSAMANGPRGETVTVKQEPLSGGSSPVFVSERPVKRRRMDGDIRPKDYPAPRQQSNYGTVANPCAVKEETTSSPVGIATPTSLGNMESLDLDELAINIFTPNKRRQGHLHTSQRPDPPSEPTATGIGYDRASSAPFQAADPRLHQTTDDPRLTRSFDCTQVKRQILDSEDENEGGSEMLLEDDFDIEDPPNIKLDPTVLQPISTSEQNVRNGRHIERKRTAAHRRSKDIAIFAEDGENFYGGSTEVDGQKDTARHAERSSDLRSPGGQRLNALLERVSSPSKPLTAETPTSRPIKTPLPTKAQPPSLVSTPTTAQKRARPAPSISEGRITPQDTYQTPFTASKGSTSASSRSLRSSNSRRAPASATSSSKDGRRSISPSDEPLRARPLDRLSLDDFKINPRAHNGAAHAYHESLRRKSDKACAPGCTDAQCCGGHFRRLVELGGNIPSLSSAGSSAGDDELLEQHFGGGDEARRRIAALNAPERRETLVQAKAAKLAEAHGKHRQRFERRKTPPGFWEVDFPSTQEELRKKEEAKQLDREEVTRRWGEAVREDGKGRWMFRDE